MIRRTVDGPIWRIELGGESELNYLSGGDLQMLGDTWEAFASDADARIAIITGNGAKAFSAGADIGSIGTSMTDDSAPERAMRYTLRGLDVGKPVIAAVDGYALGAGFEIMLAADIRICSTSAVFGVPEVRWGAVPAGGSLARLSREIPRTWAVRLLLTGERITAEKAEQLGLVTAVVPPDELHALAQSLAERILANSPAAVRAVKSHFHRVNEQELQLSYESERDVARALAGSADAAEGAAAFAEHRKPRYVE